MLYGMCIAVEDEENLRIASDYGFDYVEGNFQMLANGSAEKHCCAAEYHEKYGLDCLVANSFLPENLKVFGPDRNPSELKNYIKRGLDFGSSLGLKKVVFGSGGARKIPADYDFRSAFAETAEFLAEIASPIFKEYNTELVIEPLRREECNFINTVKEAAMLISASNADNVFCLGDIFHMYREADSFNNISDLGALIHHAHISYPIWRDGMNRSYPRKGDEFNYSDFICALKKAKCNTCSIEATTTNRAFDAAAAMKVLRKTDSLED